jgi:hypothetical protein
MNDAHPRLQYQTLMLACRVPRAVRCVERRHPSFLCVKGYLKLNMPPSKMADILWPDTKRNSSSGRAVWDPMHKRVKCLEEKSNTALVTQSQYTFEFPYDPSPVPPCELVMLHTMRKDHDDTHVIASTSVDAFHYSKTNGKRRGQVCERYSVTGHASSGRRGQVHTQECS